MDAFYHIVLCSLSVSNQNTMECKAEMLFAAPTKNVWPIPETGMGLVGLVEAGVAVVLSTHRPQIINASVIGPITRLCYRGHQASPSPAFLF